MLTELALIEKVEKMNTVVVYPNQWAGFVPRRDSYTINIDRGKNYYSCGEFRHLARNCRNWEIVGQERRLEYGDNLNNMNNNLNGKESMVVFD